MKTILILGVIVLILYGISRLWKATMGKIEDHHRISGAQRVNRIRQQAEQRNRDRPARMREEARIAVERTWGTSIRREQRRAASAWVRVGRLMASGKDPSKAAAKAARHETGISTVLGNLARELKHVDERYGTSPHKHGPRIHPATGQTLPGVRRPGHEHPGTNVPVPKKGGRTVGSIIIKKIIR